MLVQAKLTEETHVPGAQKILNDILANHKIPSEVKAGTERLVLRKFRKEVRSRLWQ